LRAGERTDAKPQAGGTPDAMPRLPALATVMRGA
jgi:hypothetical protein